MDSMRLRRYATDAFGALTAASLYMLGVQNEHQALQSVLDGDIPSSVLMAPVYEVLSCAVAMGTIYTNSVMKKYDGARPEDFLFS